MDQTDAGIRLTTKLEAATHISFTGATWGYPCPLCSCWVYNRAELQRHMDTHDVDEIRAAYLALLLGQR